jgi:hypothetical protein
MTQGTIHPFTSGGEVRMMLTDMDKEKATERWLQAMEARMKKAQTFISGGIVHGS